MAAREPQPLPQYGHTSIRPRLFHSPVIRQFKTSGRPWLGGRGCWNMLNDQPVLTDERPTDLEPCTKCFPRSLT